MNLPALTCLRVIVVAVAMSAAFRMSMPARESRSPIPATLLVTTARVWNDFDRDGLQDPDEDGIAGIHVAIVAPGSSRELSSAVTDATGHCQLQVIDLPGHYQLHFQLPAGYEFTTQNKGLDDNRDSDAGPNGLTAPFFNEGYQEHVDAGIIRTD